jgi:hypothetical protein
MTISVDPRQKRVRNRAGFYLWAIVKGYQPGKVCVRTRIPSQRCTFDDGSSTTEWRCKVGTGAELRFRLRVSVDCSCPSGETFFTRIYVDAKDQAGAQDTDRCDLEVGC